jgi:hypothetical protein
MSPTDYLVTGKNRLLGLSSPRRLVMLTSHNLKSEFDRSRLVSPECG